MRTAKLGDMLMWEGELAKVVGIAEGKNLIIEIYEEEKCPRCKRSLGRKRFSVLEDSPLFQETAKAIQTLDIGKQD